MQDQATKQGYLPCYLSLVAVGDRSVVSWRCSQSLGLQRKSSSSIERARHQSMAMTSGGKSSFDGTRLL